MNTHRWELAPGTRWVNATTLVGGSPYRVMRLKPRGADLVRALCAGDASAGRTTAGFLNRLVQANLIVPPLGNPPELDIVAVVPAKASPENVQRALDSIPDISAIVIDDGSPVALDGRLRHHAGLRVITHHSPKGPAAARNRGAAEATAEWLLFLDADISAPPGWAGRLSSMTAYADIVAPRIVTEHRPGLAGAFERATCALDLGDQPGSVGPETRVPYLPSAALLVRRATFQALGGFDESIRIGEDVDFIWRATLDHSVWYEPRVLVEHQPRPTLRAALDRRREYGRSSGVLAARHEGSMRHADVSGWAAAPGVLAILGRPLLAVATAAVSIGLAPKELPQVSAIEARRISAVGKVTTASLLARNLTRPLLPLTVLVALFFRGFRRRALLAIALSHLYRRQSPTTVPWQLLDDAAYSIGVWQAALERGKPNLLLPRIRWRRR